MCVPMFARPCIETVAVKVLSKHCEADPAQGSWCMLPGYSVASCTSDTMG